MTSTPATPTPASGTAVGIGSSELVLPPGAVARIRFLKEPAMLNVLFDEFQSDGMPMGSDRWAEYVLMRYRELCEKEKTLRKMLNAVEAMERAREYCGSKHPRAQRHKITEEFQERKRREEQEAEAAWLAQQNNGGEPHRG